jgi:hypothetical protein
MEEEMKKLDHLWEMIIMDPRIQRVLVFNAGIHNIQELLEKNRRDLLRNNGIGPGTVSIIEHILLTGGKHLKKDTACRCNYCGSLLPWWFNGKGNKPKPH